MNSTDVSPHSFEFCFPSLDTLLLVNVDHDEVEICATRNTFSVERKLSFIRELAAEGFIPDRYRYFQLAEHAEAKGVHWRVDYSWLKLDEAMIAKTRQFMLRLFSGATLLWLLMIGLLFITTHR
jgi:hypothetical protein